MSTAPGASENSTHEANDDEPQDNATGDVEDGAGPKFSVDESLDETNTLPTVQCPPQSGSTIENKNESRRASVEATDSRVISSQPRQRNGRPLRAFISGMAFIL